MQKKNISNCWWNQLYIYSSCVISILPRACRDKQNQVVRTEQIWLRNRADKNTGKQHIKNPSKKSFPISTSEDTLAIQASFVTTCRNMRSLSRFHLHSRERITATLRALMPFEPPLCFRVNMTLRGIVPFLIPLKADFTLASFRYSFKPLPFNLYVEVLLQIQRDYRLTLSSR